MDKIYDICIIGAGPAGMMASIHAGLKGLKVIILEKKSRPAIKLSITGKGRCNITNSASIREFVELFYQGKFLYSAFHAFSNTDTISFFESLGVSCKLDRGGRYFPESDKASDVVNVLVKNAKKFAKIVTSFDVKSIEKCDSDIFFIKSSTTSVLSKKVIVATGGLSYPGTGSTGDGYKFAKSFGHSVKEPMAALIPILLESKYLDDLKGLKLKNVKVSLDKSCKTIFEKQGEMEFTCFGVDGPIILTMSALVSEYIKKSNLNLKINLKPGLSRECLDARLLRELDKFGRCQLKDMLKDFLPMQLIKTFLKYCNINITRKCSHVTKVDREKMLDIFFGINFKICGTKNIKDAIITRGGVMTKEINPKTMESKLVEDLYFCGEVIDIDAPTGGFNLQAAFSTGVLAGMNA